MKKRAPTDKRLGPLVETGPNAGKVRARNTNGQWRRKRRDAGAPRGPRNHKMDK